MNHADRAIRALLRTPWAITEAKLDEILGFLEAHTSGERLSEAEARERFGAARPTGTRTLRQIAVIPIYGTIMPRANLMTAYSGGTSVQQLAANFNAALQNDDVSAIVLDVDSPGGSVAGIEEMARRIYRARGTKPIHAVANYQMASAAYYLASQADEIAISPSAEVGSIGVFMIHTDVSEAAEKAGIKHTVIKAGRYKAEGHSYAPLGEEAEAALQADVNEFYDLFVAAVAKGRGVKESAVRNGFGEGRCLSAKRAVQEGLGDRVATLEEVIDRLRGGKGGGRRRAATVLSARAPGERWVDSLALPEVDPSTYAEDAPPLPLLRASAALPYLAPMAGAAADDDPERRDCPECGSVMTAREDGDWECLDCGYTEGDPESRTSDGTTGQDAGGAAPIEAISPPEHSAAPGAKENTVETTTTTAAPGTPGPASIDVNAAIAAERKRAGDVRALALSHGLDAAKANALADEGLTVEAAASRILAEIQTRAAAEPSIRVGADRAAQKPFASLGEQLLAIREAGMPGRTAISPRLLEINAAATGAGSDVPSDGGFLIQTDLAPGIVDRIYDIGQVSSQVRRVPISPNANGLKVNAVDESSRANGSRWGGVQAYWAGEADTVTATKPKFRQMELDLKKLFGIMYMTDELVQDAVALSAIAEQAFSEELGFKVEDGIFRGTGAGQMLGFLNSAALVTVTEESAQADDTIVTANVLKMWSRLWARSRRNAAWFINQEIEPQLYPLTLGSGTAVTLLYTPPGMNGNNTEFGRLMGRPVIPVEYASAIGDVGDISLVDLDQYLMIDKDGPQQAYSIHVRFIYDEQTFRVTYRCDGQPIWNKPLTPFKGAGTLSPYVTLGAR